MPKSVRIKLNKKGIRALLSGPEVQKDLHRRTARIQKAAGAGFEKRVQVSGGSSKLGRAMGYVITADDNGRRKQARSNTLQRSLNSGK